MIAWLKRILSGGDIPPPLEASPPTEEESERESESGEYSSDSPISSRSLDRFNRAGFASRIAETIATRIDPSSIVLGLYGPWGDGKTSALEMMQEKLADFPRVVVVRFNPWHFQSEEVLLRGFFATLAETMGRSLPSLKEKAGDLLQKYGSLLSLASVTLGGGVELNPGNAASGIGTALSNVSLDDLRKRIEAMLAEHKRRLVILIDDIDRLDRDETHAIFKLVKLSASFKHTSYVLAFDDEVVSAALGERYGEGGLASGRAFLEKIIQVPLHLPPADERSLRQLALEGVQSALNQADVALSQEQVDAFVRHFDDGIRPRVRTPRRAKLYANALMFSLPILKGEVNPVDLMLIEGIRIFYPDLYVGIRENPDLFLRGLRDSDRGSIGAQRATRLETLLSRCLPDLSTEERGVITNRLLIPLFPRIENTIYGAEWERTWSAEQKACSEHYFTRYFTYGVPLGDVRDAEVAQLISCDATDDEKRNLLESFANRQALPRVIRMLRQRQEVLTDDAASALITALAQNAHLLPRERGMMVLTDTMAQAGILISELLRRTPFGEARQMEAERVLRIAEPLNFAAECFRWIRHYEDRPEERRVLSDEGTLPLQRILGQRIEEQNLLEPLYLAFPKDAPNLYWTWVRHTSNEYVRDALIARFDVLPAEVDSFLSCFVGEAWGMDSGLPRPGDLRREQYNSLSELVPAQYIAANLMRRLGGELENPQQYPDENWSAPRRLAHQFMYLHQYVLQEIPATPDDIDNR
jgi:hypothetical protein